jgi:3-deoxy-manno-octulosonate cytidylyltransferase (CMP-KDO synthetase)
MKIIAVIPARFASTRFPGKPLVDIAGKSMIRRVIDQATQVKGLADVIVATDDERIADHVREYGTRVIMTSPDHPSGTDRCLEALVNSQTNAEAVINIQGDEPFVAVEQIELLMQMMQNPVVDIATLCIKIEDTQILKDPNKVKVISDVSGRAIYFSRHPIPYQKSVEFSEWLNHHDYYKHLGLYAYKADALHKICSLRPSPLELAESLEQLRWLENGYTIHVGKTVVETPAIDTPEDLTMALSWMRNM